MLLLRVGSAWVVVLLSLFLGAYAPQAQGQSCLQGFGGVWKTQHGSMTLTVKGNEVSGTYGGSRTVSGTVVGGVFTGTWRHANGRWGRIRFIHDGNGKFAGNYGEKDAALSSNWWSQCSGSLPGSGGGHDRPKAVERRADHQLRRLGLASAAVLAAVLAAVEPQGAPRVSRAHGRPTTAK